MEIFPRRIHLRYYDAETSRSQNSVFHDNILYCINLPIFEFILLFTTSDSFRLNMNYGYLMPLLAKQPTRSTTALDLSLLIHLSSKEIFN